MRARLLALTVVALVLPAAPAVAGDPIMPLSDVRAGMQCTGYSVVQGTTISSFGVEILDVVDGDASGQGPRLLVRVSGPAVDGTGVGPGFSGSPIYCPDGQGAQRNAGAISESLGEYGGEVVLATPIEAILGARVDAPAGGAKASRRDRRLMSRAKPLATPLTVSGLSHELGRALERAGARKGRQVIAAPAGPLGSFPPQPMAPGAAIGVSYSMGDIQVGAIGTVAYTDGDGVWAFGHSFEGAGARRLLLQDAYVYRVIDNPVAIPGAATTYKYASLGHTLGTISNDERDAVAGRTGALPPTVPVRVFANDLDTGRSLTTGIRAADESRIGLPEGASPLTFVGPLAVTEAASSLLRSAPGRLSADACVQISIGGLPRPVRFCNRYISAFPADEDFVGTANTVAGRTGALPPTVPVRVFANDLDTGRSLVTGIRAADESRIGLPEGSSPLTFVGPLAVTEAASSLLRSAPGRLSADVCVQISIGGLPRPVRFCNRYVSAFPADEDFVGTANTVAARASQDVFDALARIDDYQGRPPEIREVAVRMDIRRGEQRAFLRSVKLPERVRPGQEVRARVTLRRVRGGVIHRSYRMTIPHGLRRGERVLEFGGTDVDVADDGLLGAIIIDGIDDGAGYPGPRNLRALAKGIRGLERYDGVRVSAGGVRRRAFRDGHLRISGRASTRVRVSRR